VHGHFVAKLSTLVVYIKRQLGIASHVSVDKVTFAKKIKTTFFAQYLEFSLADWCMTWLVSSLYQEAA